MTSRSDDYWFWILGRADDFVGMDRPRLDMCLAYYRGFCGMGLPK